MASFSNYMEFVQVFGSNGDLIRNFYAAYSTVQGNTGDDIIFNFSEYSVIDGGEADDYIGNSAANVTILGGGGQILFCPIKILCLWIFTAATVQTALQISAVGQLLTVKLIKT